MRQDVRHLLKNATYSFYTIVLDCVLKANTALFRRALSRADPDFEQKVAEGSIVMFEARRTSTSGDDEETVSSYDHRVWWRKPACWRDEITMGPGGPGTVLISCGDLSSAYIAGLRTVYTNQHSQRLVGRLGFHLRPRSRQSLPTVAERLSQMPLIDPSFSADGWTPRELDRTSHAGRSAIRASATRLDAGYQPCLWEGIDEYELLVDEERGVLLSCTGFIDGETANSLSVRSVTFDEAIPDDVFLHQPPSGTKIVRA